MEFNSDDDDDNAEQNNVKEEQNEQVRGQGHDSEKDEAKGSPVREQGYESEKGEEKDSEERGHEYESENGVAVSGHVYESEKEEVKESVIEDVSVKQNELPESEAIKQEVPCECQIGFTEQREQHVREITEWQSQLIGADEINADNTKWKQKCEKIQNEQNMLGEKFQQDYARSQVISHEIEEEESQNKKLKDNKEELIYQIEQKQSEIEELVLENDNRNKELTDQIIKIEGSIKTSSDEASKEFESKREQLQLQFDKTLKDKSEADKIKKEESKAINTTMNQQIIQKTNEVKQLQQIEDQKIIDAKAKQDNKMRIREMLQQQNQKFAAYREHLMNSQSFAVNNIQNILGNSQGKDPNYLPYTLPTIEAIRKNLSIPGADAILSELSQIKELIKTLTFVKPAPPTPPIQTRMSTTETESQDAFCQGWIQANYYKAQIKFQDEPEQYQSVIADDFKGNQGVMVRLNELLKEKEIIQIAKMRGDGNCFFRSFITAYMQAKILSLQSQNPQGLDSFFSTLLEIPMIPPIKMYPDQAKYLANFAQKHLQKKVSDWVRSKNCLLEFNRSLLDADTDFTLQLLCKSLLVKASEFLSENYPDLCGCLDLEDFKKELLEINCEGGDDQQFFVISNFFACNLSILQIKKSGSGYVNENSCSWRILNPSCSNASPTMYSPLFLSEHNDQNANDLFLMFKTGHYCVLYTKNQANVISSLLAGK